MAEPHTLSPAKPVAESHRLSVTSASGCLLLLLFGSATMSGGCCESGDTTDGGGEVKGTVYTFTERATGGVARLCDMSGKPLSEPVEIDSNGRFSIFGEELPERFLVLVTGIEPWAAGDAPSSTRHRLEAVVEYSHAMRTNVTPLTSIVAHYAMLTGASLEDADRAVGQCLTFWPIHSPSKLAPLSSEDLTIHRFSFHTLRASWITSGLPLEDYLTQLAECVRGGETTLEFGDENVSDIGSSIGKWILNKIVDGIGAKTADAGIGWMSRLVFGEQPDQYMQKLEEISRKLDDIKKSVIDVGRTLEQEINDLGQDIKLDLITAQINIYAAPLGWYDQLTVDMPYHAGRLDDAIKTGDKTKEEEEHRQLKDIASTITDSGVNSCYNRTTSALGTMHDMIALSHGGLGRSLYALVADAMTGKIESGTLSLDRGLAQYMELFNSLANAQLKGLMLQVEFLHKQHEGSDENCRHYVSRAVDLYKERMDRQAEEFLNGLERLLVLFAGGDSTRDYHTSAVFPVDGGSKYYARFDALVGDMVGADSQVVVRLLWDAKKAEQYPTFFSFMNERLSKLENPAQPLELQLDDHGGTTISPVTGKENGTVNPVERKRIGEETVTKAVVRRYIFRNFRCGEPVYFLTARREHLDVFNMDRNDIPLPGSMGPFLLPYNGYQGTELLKVPTYDDDAHRYITVPLFAWLPETLMLDVGQPILDGPHFAGMGYRPLEMRRYCYGIRSQAVGKYVQIQTVYPGDRVAVCNTDRDGALAHRLDPTAETTLPVRYGDGVISILGTQADQYHPAAYFHLEKVKVTYLPQYQYYLYHMLPAPTFVERFIDPIEASIVREDIPFRLRGIQAWKLAAVGSNNWIYPVNVHYGTVPPEELFSFERVAW